MYISVVTKRLLNLFIHLNYLTMAKKTYSFRDVDMLMASKTIAENFLANISELAALRTNWSEEYARDLIQRIDTSMDSWLGTDAKKDLRQATAELGKIQAPAKRDLSFFKTQIDEDFKKDPKRRDEILKKLGFNTLLKKVQMRDQEALIQLLFSMKKNMSDSLKNEITAKGMDPGLIDRILAYAEEFSQANTRQEVLKLTTKEITKELRLAFNDIYDEIIGICKKASHYYQYEPLKKEQFTFAKVKSNLNIIAKKQ